MKKGKLEFQINQKKFFYQGDPLNQMLFSLSKTEGISMDEALCLFIDRTLEYYGDSLSKICLEEMELKETEWKNHTHGKELELRHCRLSSTNYFYGFDSVLMDQCSLASNDRNSLGILADHIILTKCNVSQSVFGTYLSLLGETIHLVNSKLTGEDLHIRADQILVANHTTIDQNSVRVDTPLLCCPNSKLATGLLEWNVTAAGHPLEEGSIAASSIQYQGIPFTGEDDASFEYFINIRSKSYQKILQNGK